MSSPASTHDGVPRSEAAPQRIQRPLSAGVVRGAYAEREIPEISMIDELGERLAGPFQRAWQSRKSSWTSIVEAVEPHTGRLETLSIDELHDEIRTLRRLLLERGFAEETVGRTFALIREMSGRVLGMKHYDVQLMGGYVLLKGMVAEMQTGEGKTLTATLPAIAAALASVPVHIVTVNDYLAERDAETLEPLYRAFGLSVGVIVSGMDPAARREAYGCDVTYCTNKEVAFDYLKDRIVLAGHPSRQRLRLERLVHETGRVDRLIHRGLYFAIVDEADSILVDEARTPLIISGGKQDASKDEFYRTALMLAEDLVAGVDFKIEGAERQVLLTERGCERLEVLAEDLTGLWQGRRRREELVRQGLSALHLFHKDQHYLVAEDKVQIIDEYTGRVMPDRSWEHGLHQMIEAKEDVPLSGQQDTLARISYQRFFSRYHKLAGMTGTAQEVAGELWSTYKLPVVEVPTNRPCVRVELPQRVYETRDQKWRAVLARVEELHAEGRPVLVGTRSVEASEILSELMGERGIPHQVLNARQDAEEAEVVSQAGERGRVTVATNMAGRGTDIKLSPGVADLGGLYVIGTEGHDSRRIDRQLGGRSARQGDPGTVEFIISLEDELCELHGSPVVKRLAAVVGAGDGERAHRIRSWVPASAQRRAGRMHSRMRGDLKKMDERMESLLAFSGRSD